jgi:LysM repeat protein
MNDKPPEKRSVRKSPLVDVFVILVFLSTAVYSLYLFRLDLLRTIDSMDAEPAGIIIIRNNVVQRRHSDRVLWDRLFVESPVYSGDLIRAAELSAATVYIADNQINLNENTLIRIQQMLGWESPLRIELKEGNLSLTAGAESKGITLDLMGRQVQAAAGTLLNAVVADDGIEVQVNEGNAVFIEEGRVRELSEGTVIAQDASGVDRVRPTAVVLRPQPGARYLKNSLQPLMVGFMWNRGNFEEGETLRLEIAADKFFVKSLRAIDGLVSGAQAPVDAGLWYWRLSLGDVVLSAGQFTVADAAGPDLLSPAMNSVFRYHSDLPQIRFQWSGKSGASHYLLEVSDTGDFIHPQISRQLSAASFIQPELGQGTWYWRVRPVFSSVYEGESAYSDIASFRIEQNSDPQAPAIEVPKPAIRERRKPAPATGWNYTVQSGDTLHQIARRVYGFAALWPRIVDVNDIPNPDLIYVDQVLFIPTLNEDESYP